MIQLTYTFSSQAELAAHLAALQGQAAPAAPEAAPAKKSKPATSAPAPAVPAPTAPIAEAAVVDAPEPKQTSESATTPPAAAPAAEPAAIDYGVLQKAVFILAAKSREACAKLVAEFGVKTFKELDQSRWPEALAAVNSKIAELS